VFPENRAELEALHPNAGEPPVNGAPVSDRLGDGEFDRPAGPEAGAPPSIRRRRAMQQLADAFFEPVQVEAAW